MAGACQHCGGWLRMAAPGSGSGGVAALDVGHQGIWELASLLEASHVQDGHAAGLQQGQHRHTCGLRRRSEARKGRGMGGASKGACQLSPKASTSSPTATSAPHQPPAHLRHRLAVHQLGIGPRLEGLERGLARGAAHALAHCRERKTEGARVEHHACTHCSTAVLRYCGARSPARHPATQAPSRPEAPSSRSAAQPCTEAQPTHQS